MPSEILFIEGLRLLTALLQWTAKTNISVERLLAEKRKADTEGRELTPEYLSQVDADAQAAIDRLRGAAPPG